MLLVFPGIFFTKNIKEYCYRSLFHYSELLPLDYTSDEFREVVSDQYSGVLLSCEPDTISFNAA